MAEPPASRRPRSGGESNPSIPDSVSHLSNAAAAGHYDELRAASGAPGLASPWQAFFETLGPQEMGQLDQRFQSLQRQVLENGITYNVYAEQDGPQRPWAIDLFPLLLGADDWSALAKGVVQRARVLDALMQDAYGPQRLLREALVPAALVHGHPDFLRELQGKPAVDAFPLHVAAFDLGRGPEGRWAVISQRVQAPSGMGYLLENRGLIRRQFAEAYAHLGVQDLGATYQRWLQALREASPAGSAAQIALLTPGPFNETYFEHAYLARHLGIALVEGSDLTVRDQRLYWRTLRGLEPVDILIKRLDDAFLDPLELRPDSTLGVPGLLQAVRAGHVMLANPPGTAWLESPALLGFLPGLCERILGETLQLPSLDTWWCGERSAMDAVLPHLGRTVIKPTYPASAYDEAFVSTLGGSLSLDLQDQWRGRIVREPHRYTLQAYQPLSQMPTWRGHRIVPQSVVLRVFALRVGPEAWEVLPGGLARIASAQAEIASMQRGGSSADVWVLSNAGSAPPNPAPVPPNRPTARARAVTSRAGENLFWLGRYTERSENAQRLASLCLQQLQRGDLSPPIWVWLQGLCSLNSLVPAELPRPARSGDDRHEAKRLLFERTLVAGLHDLAQPSLGYNLAAMARTAASLRERLSPQQWQAISQLSTRFAHWQSVPGQALATTREEALRVLAEVATDLVTITGAQNDRMTRDDGWQLLTLGRLVERLGFLAQSLRTALEVVSSTDAEAIATLGRLLMELADGQLVPGADHAEGDDQAAWLARLVVDAEHPRSLHWVCKTIRARLNKLAQTPLGQDDGLAQGLPAAADLSLDSLCDAAGAVEQEPLTRLLTQLEAFAWQVSDGLAQRYFTHAESVGSVGA